MPGAFAHITLVNLARSDKKFESINLNKKARKALYRYLEFIELGSVSPDYPYLALGSKHKYWADYVHVKYRTSKIIVKAVKQIRKIKDKKEQRKAFSWLCGFVGHIVTDLVIHPVVELKVGTYLGNEKEHRICEMNQDVYIYKRLRMGDIGATEHLKSGISTCNHKNDTNLIYKPIKKIWEEMLKEADPKRFKTNKPNIDKWHKSFNKIVNISEEGQNLFALARHVAVGQGLTYPIYDEIDKQYIKNLKVPSKSTMHYDDIFDKALADVLESWKVLGDAVYGQDDSFYTYFVNGNLDNGRDLHQNLIYWA
jgi:hypothetical protein